MLSGGYWNVEIDQVAIGDLNSLYHPLEHIASVYLEYHLKPSKLKHINAVMGFFNSDAKFIDPHYPNVHMKGKEEILDGLTWGFKSLKKLGFTIINYYEGADGTSASVEVATAHELPNGKKLNFSQVFIVELKGGKISRCKPMSLMGHMELLDLC